MAAAVATTVPEARARLTQRVAGLLNKIPDAVSDPIADACTAILEADTIAGAVRAGRTLRTAIRTACAAPANNLTQKPLLEDLAAIEMLATHARELGRNATGPISAQQDRDRVDLTLWAPKENAMKAKSLTTRLLYLLGTEEEPILSCKMFKNFAWAVNPIKATQRNFQQPRPDFLQVLGKCRDYVASAAFDNVQRQALLAIAASVAEHPADQDFRFNVLFGQNAAPPFSEAASALLQCGWHMTAKVVCYYEALEERRIYPKTEVDQVMSYLTPFRCFEDRPLPESLHNGTYGVEEDSPERDDTPVVVDERRAAATSPKAQRQREVYCNWCGFPGHHQSECQQKAHTPKKGKSERAKIKKAQRAATAGKRRS
uniref:Uncharacterized protein n=1 Tax=Neobodo designis TaxID=312471 RepID=A0A7S1QDP7_NEODS|eukprot:CAMPEP_0174835038 /NCGR_PEP_ID=MMETSP1114-20130205/5193_1 /TAXON_ID=312471 /ORGANISM="Neobodo designis, Strain CCAP 1951/1" /LENGTH=371 /DNA_ID=CAMNT_0016068979 /DNA_START=27 /DNA_END=1142 /DNA_ORIENTATION=-